MKLRPYFLVVVALSALGLLVAPQLILSAPREATMGFVQKIFYYHVPSAMDDLPGRLRLRLGIGALSSSRAPSAATSWP